MASLPYPYKVRYDLYKDSYYIQFSDGSEIALTKYDIENNHIQHLASNIFKSINLDMLKQINYPPLTKPPLEENNDMATGVEYLARPFGNGQGYQNYTHLRTMLHVLWRDNRTPTDHPSRCIPDVKFGKDARRINGWIKHYFNDNQINAAHEIARREYGGRGRKPGALSNKTLAAILGDERNDAANELAPPYPSLAETFAEATNPISRAEPMPNGEIDVSQFIKRPEFEAVNNAVSEKFAGVHTSLDILGKSAIELGMRIDAIQLSKPTIVELAQPNVPNIQLGQQHHNFPDLLIMCSAVTIAGLRNNVWLHGPAGTGKSTAGKMIAKAFNLPYYSLGALETGLQITGYKDAAGVFQTMTPFYECWRNGGVIMLDEIDAYTPSALLALNGALVDSVYAFACGMVDKHKDCIIIGSANTVGLGGTSEYTGRMKQDAANRNRWVFLDWAHDDALEDMLCPNKEWLTYVRKVRLNLTKKPQQGVMITMRASIYGESLLRAGASWDRTVRATLRDGMSDAQWAQVA